LSSRELVSLLKRHHKAEIEAEREALMELGLMVVAGRVTSRKCGDPSQLEIFQQHKNLREFTSIRRRDGNRVKRVIVQTLSITPDAYFGQPEPRKSEKPQNSSSSPSLRSLMEEMLSKGDGKKSLGEYLIK